VGPSKVETVGVEKLALTVRLTREVVVAVERYQAETRSTGRSSRRNTTVGAIVDRLLRLALDLPALEE
jgi:hypothetical protein